MPGDPRNFKGSLVSSQAATGRKSGDCLRRNAGCRSRVASIIPEVDRIRPLRGETDRGLIGWNNYVREPLIGYPIDTIGTRRGCRAHPRRQNHDNHRPSGDRSSPLAEVEQQPVMPKTRQLPAGVFRRQTPDGCNGRDKRAHHDCDLIEPSHIVSTTRNSAFPLIIRS
jgi:hypothetical protein